MVRWGNLTTCVVFVFFFCTGNVQAAEYKFDVTIFDNSPLVGASSNEEYRTMIPWNRKDAAYAEIGRWSDTGTGKVGTGYPNPGDGDRVPDGSGLPSGTYIDIEPYSGTNGWVRMEVKFLTSSSTNRIGAFYATAKRGHNSLTIPIIKLSETATITPSEYTKTIGIGESITLNVTSNVNNLRWVLNNGNIITDWNNLTGVKIHKVRRADEGIYECFEDGKRELGQHAIMRLIVRACPSSKYGTNCSNNCVTCWNGGVCSADNGVCLCQPGFAGAQCGERLGSNKFGAQGSILCSSSGGNCRNALICGPDPIGCSCAAGYMGLDCKKACPSGWYGSNCHLECHCDISVCDPAMGCTNVANCLPGHRANFCQGCKTCSNGYFGAQCEFRCHCYEGGGCDNQTGVCENAKCAYGWGGRDCQQALPYFYNNKHITANATGNSVRIAWNRWDQTIDFGTGSVDHYRIYSDQDAPDSSTMFLTSVEPNILISDLLPGSMYSFKIAAVKLVDAEIMEGPRSLNVRVTTHPCGTHETVTNIQMSADNSITWDEPPHICPLHFEYHVKVSLISIDNCEKSTTVIFNTTLTSTNITLRNLTYLSTYRLAIQARAVDRWNTKYGYGMTYTTEFTTKESVPSGVPQNVKPQPPQNGHVIFTWDLPPCGYRHGNVVGYEYEYLLDAKHYGQNTTFKLAEVFTFNEIRRFRVRAFTAEGPGPYSDPLTLHVFGSDSITVIGGVAYITIISALIVIIVVLLIVVIILSIKRRRHNSGKAIPSTSSVNESGQHNDEAISPTGGINEAYQDLDIRTREKEHHYQGTVKTKPVTSILDYQKTSHQVMGTSDETGYEYTAATGYEVPISGGLDTMIYEETSYIVT